METESVGIYVCCAISQVGTHDFLINSNDAHTPVEHKKNLIICQL